MWAEFVCTHLTVRVYVFHVLSVCWCALCVLGMVHCTLAASILPNELGLRSYRRTAVCVLFLVWLYVETGDDG